MKKIKFYRDLLLAGLIMMHIAIFGQDILIYGEEFLDVQEEIVEESMDTEEESEEELEEELFVEIFDSEVNNEVNSEEGRKENSGENKEDNSEDNSEMMLEEILVSNELVLEESLVNDFVMSVTEDTANVKAGQQLGYEVLLENIGDLDLEDIEIRGIVDGGNLSGEWLPVSGASPGKEDGTITIDLLEAGTSKEIVYMVAIPEERQTDLEAEFIAKTQTLCKAANVVTEIVPLKVEFSVKKWADRARAVPGDTITYQICIRNTGERSLHSVLTTEKFQEAGLKAEFQEMEGVILNGAKTEALISEIRPGEAVGLYATVVLPEDFEGGDILNEVTVVTRETGENSLSAQSVVTIENILPTEIPLNQEISNVYETTDDDTGKVIPQTSDLAESEAWARAFGISSLVIIGIYWIRKGKRKH